jgi:hypothetical protein
VIVKYDPEQWSLVAEKMHTETFKEFRPSSLNRIDFALVCWGDEPLGYMTCREMDSESLYIGYGGVLPANRKSTKSFNGYLELLAYIKERYLRASTLIENNNIEMIRLAHKVGFRITGIRNFKSQIFLEHTIEWSE